MRANTTAEMSALAEVSALHGGDPLKVNVDLMRFAEVVFYHVINDLGGCLLRIKSAILRALLVNPQKGECMADLDAVLEQLRRERKRAVGELKQLERVITTLSRMKTGSRSTSGSGRHMRSQLSAAARERIAAAQRARWAKVRAQSKKSS